MSKMMKERAGSALLIVLGMLSFMVVSAVGFSIYMRTSRAPSSHLRRESTARYLLKSALANAISRIDGELNDNGYVEGVYNDVYPGVGPAQKLMDWQNGDLWTHRVFTPFGLTNSASTVSTLTLEGLAYLPPAIINEVRVYSRLSRTAAWRNLSYDLGRYAFTAVDVSDCFDINRLRATERRSSAPGMRVNLSSLFDSNGSALDSVLQQANTVPFVSLADFNLVGDGPFTPFAQYIGSNGGSFYNAGDEAYISNALFVVDTWFPATNAVGTAKEVEMHDISAKKENQPFRSYSAASFLDLAKRGSSTELGRELQKNLGIGFACLYDYLDADQIPISLAIPTVETAPMVCGLGLISTGPSSLMPKVEESPGWKTFEYTKNDAQGRPHTIQRTISRTAYKGIGASTLMLTGVAAFPFKRVDSGRKGTYRVEAVAAVFMADKNISCRLDASSPIRPTKNDWSGGTRDGILFFKGSANLPFPENITKTTDALTQFSVPLQAPSEVESSLYFSVTDQDVTQQNDDGEPAHMTFDPFKTADSTQEGNAFVVYGTTGQKVETGNLFSGGYQKEILEKAALETGSEQSKITFTSAAEYRPMVAVWVRVLNGSDTVDLAPAVFADDEDWLQGVSYGSLKDNPTMDELAGGGTPILDFVTDKVFKYNEDGLKTLDGTAANLDGWSELYATDPRFNFAPEDWFGKKESGGDVTPSSWLTALGADTTTGSGGAFGSGGRDSDIFMFTSDQEYLQSMGELAFLPNLQELDGTAELIGRGSYNNKGRYTGNNKFNERTWSGIANINYAWKTYTPVDHGNGYDPIYELMVNNKPIVAGSGDFRANPFSPDSRVLAAVVKDTPYDYYVASTNDELTILKLTSKVSEARKYAFGPESRASTARWQDDEIEEISDRLITGFRERAREDSRVTWMGVYDNLAWFDGKSGDNQLSFLGSSDLNEPLHGVDRKFLYSFWRECFQDRQQLFLVFIRAEPLSVGGSSDDAISNSQLGARGVALVWRDPLPAYRSGSSSESGKSTTSRQMSRSVWQDDLKTDGPHRTRVLFYHQFD